MKWIIWIIITINIITTAYSCRTCSGSNIIGTTNNCTICGPIRFLNFIFISA